MAAYVYTGFPTGVAGAGSPDFPNKDTVETLNWRDDLGDVDALAAAKRM